MSFIRFCYPCKVIDNLPPLNLLVPSLNVKYPLLPGFPTHLVVAPPLLAAFRTASYVHVHSALLREDLHFL